MYRFFGEIMSRLLSKILLIGYKKFALALHRLIQRKPGLRNTTFNITRSSSPCRYITGFMFYFNFFINSPIDFKKDGSTTDANTTVVVSPHPTPVALVLALFIIFTKARKGLLT